MTDNVPIELTPYQALTLMTFFEAMKDAIAEQQYGALRDAIKAFEDQLTAKIRIDQIDDAKAERAINELFGREP